MQAPSANDTEFEEPAGVAACVTCVGSNVANGICKPARAIVARVMKISNQRQAATMRGTGRSINRNGKFIKTCWRFSVCFQKETFKKRNMGKIQYIIDRYNI